MAPWRNLCKSWTVLKKWLRPKCPPNVRGWKALPLWRPHINHINPALARCSTNSSRSLSECGFNVMGDLQDGDGRFISWDEAIGRGAVANGENAFRRLLANCKAIPEVCSPSARLPMFLEGSIDGGPPIIWQFTVPAERLTDAWVPFLDRNSPDRAFLRDGPVLRPMPWNCPGPHTALSRAIVGSPGHSRPGFPAQDFPGALAGLESHYAISMG